MQPTIHPFENAKNSKQTNQKVNKLAGNELRTRGKGGFRVEGKKQKKSPEGMV